MTGLRFRITEFANEPHQSRKLMTRDALFASGLSASVKMAIESIPPAALNSGKQCV